MSLSDQVQELVGPNHELDARIWCAVFAPEDAYVEQSKFNFAWCIYQGTGRNGQPRLWEARNSRIQPVTETVEAARMIVPKGWWTQSTQIRFGFWQCKLWHGDKSIRVEADAEAIAQLESCARTAAALKAQGL